MDSTFLQIGVGGIFSLMVIREVLTFVKEKKNGGEGLLEKISALISVMAIQQKDLHEWHKPDPTGKQNWKNAELAEAIDRNTEVIKELMKMLRGMNKNLV